MPLNRPDLRLPGLPSGIRAPFRTLGPGSVSSLLKIALDVAYVLLMIITAVLLLAFVVAIFIPIENYNVTYRGVQQPLTRSLTLSGLGSFSAYFGGFLLVLRNLRMVFSTLAIGDPFQPENVSRLRQIGLILAVVTIGSWLVQGLIAAQLASRATNSQGAGELLTPVFSILVVFVLAEVFREGARLRRESELTI
ncbi:MAG: DUF2975 domain-containing protein [Brevundimonas sp.]|uniref:DUF2975 domain-containing protein n=1 Tax=Brevundimonas sp. TaxID=1871086 RepID=UPI0027345C28|nr:DUF2975 domain-containing protein [Brevundimonas sp.]MDP3404701.1 DUF2975 domain-containing protein [Brevundimonas sp.]